MTQLLVSGMRASAFRTTFEFRDDADRVALEEAGDVFEWLEQTRRVDERAAFLVSTVFPAILGDMLHCVYEALESSRKGKLNITYMLVRKPLQESLFVLESVIANRHDFAHKLMTDPIKLWSQTAGGIEVHTNKIQTVLSATGDIDRFDAGYIAQLRYDKAARDGFDGPCNQAIHLFTSHKSIRTEPFNINFIFSDLSSKMTQWSYLYSRLPYLLIYTHGIVENVCATISPAPTSYLEDMDRRISALVLLWWETVEPNYADENLHKFVVQTRLRLFGRCHEAGFRHPTREDLVKMGDTGAYPGEARAKIAERNREFVRAAVASGSISAKETRPRIFGVLRHLCRQLLKLKS